jgi:signal transduction histidine kinase
MRDVKSSKWIYQSVYYLATGLTYTAIMLRSILLYQSTPYLVEVLGLLLCFLLLFLVENSLSKRMGSWFHLYLVLQTILVSLLLFGPNFKQYDYFSLLYAILGMQALQSLNYQSGIAWIGFFLILIGFPFIRFEGLLEGLIRVLLFGSVIIFLSVYSLATRRAQEANSHNQSLMEQLEEANLQLETHSNTLKQLGVANERQRLARELHDSVTQTIFSMTLTTQSALLLLERDPRRVGTQLERLNQLSQSALAEMHTLISELRPEQQVGSGLELELRQHIESRHIREGLAVSLEVDGDQALSAQEDLGLFRIAQEALNNVVKHAHATKSILRLHMIEPFWIEIEDDGQGFNLEHAQGSGRLGLSGMRERADEIDWDLSIRSTPGAGTHIRVEKKYPAEERV